MCILSFAGLIILLVVAMMLFGGLFCYRGYVKHSSRRRHAETRWTPPSDYGYEAKVSVIPYGR